MVFTKGTPTAPRCQFSRQLLEILTAQNIRFSSFNILADEEVRQAMKSFSDWPTFPQVSIDLILCAFMLPKGMHNAGDFF